MICHGDVTFERAQQIADAVLFEGYVLYPYRASSTKNRYRWTFGVLAPSSWSEAGGCESWWSQSEVLVERPEDRQAPVRGRVRFLHVIDRRVEAWNGETFEATDELSSNGEVWVPWEEGAVSEIAFDANANEASVAFALDAVAEIERVVDLDGAPIGRVVRTRAAIAGTIRTTRERVEGHGGALERLRVRVENVTAWPDATSARAEIMRASLVSTHVLLAVDGGAFVSLQDPPEHARDAANACANVRTYPVLAGEEGRRDLLLSSPIILSDHPAIAPESAGDFYDSAEIDELLALRTSTLLPEEKRLARATDPRAAALVDRVEAMTELEMSRLHGATRDRRPAPAVDERFRRGTRVRLAPGRGGRRTDAQDLLFAGRTATIEDVREDVDGRAFLAVTLDDDPAAELHRAKGRFHFYYPDEVDEIEAVSATKRVLVAGIGNVFLGDDGFGVAVAERLAASALPEGTRVVDFGIRGVHLAFELMSPPDLLVLVDATSRAGAPGMLYLIDPSTDAVEHGSPDAHAMTPGAVFACVRQMGGALPPTRIVGCEPAELEEGMGLSDPVRQAIEPAIEMIRGLINHEVRS